MSDTLLLIVAMAGIVGICALLLYPPRRAVAPRRRVDYQRIARLERELGLSPPPPRRPGGRVKGPRETREQIEAAGYEPIEITQLGDPEPRYVRGGRR